MATTKEYDNKLHSLRNTEKMTRTMKLVSMSKLYRAQEDQRKASVYAGELNNLISRLSTAGPGSSAPDAADGGPQRLASRFYL